MSSGAVIATIITKKRQEAENNDADSHNSGPIYHSAIMWLLFGWIALYIPAIYYTISPKHKWRW